MWELDHAWYNCRFKNNPIRIRYRKCCWILVVLFDDSFYFKKDSLAIFIVPEPFQWPTLSHPALTKFLKSRAAAWRIADPISNPLSSCSLCASCKVSWLNPGLCFKISSSRSAALLAPGSGDKESCRALARVSISLARINARARIVDNKANQFFPEFDNFCV